MEPDVFVLDPRHAPLALDPAASSPGASRRRVLAGGPEGCVVAFFGPFLLAGVLVAGLAADLAWRLVALAAAGVDATATVTGRREVEGDDSTTYRLRFRAPGPDGPVDGEDEVDRATYRATPDGAPVAVRLLPGEAGSARLWPPSWTRPVVLSLFALAWNACVWPVWVHHLLGLRRTRRLAREGVVVEGTVTGASARAAGEDDDHQVTVEYTVRDPRSGRRRSGATAAVRNDLKGQPLPAAGTPCRVLWVDADLHRLL